MSVYKRPDKTTYSYDFILRGRRFSGDTGASTKREAQRVEEERKQAAKVEVTTEASFFSNRMTFEVASSRWWIEVGQHAKDTATVLRNLDWLAERIGRKTDLTDVTDSIVAGLVAKRRGERTHGRSRNRFVTPATVNRTCTQPLREVITRAKTVWGVEVADVNFGKHMLKEPQERVREATKEEEDAIMGQLERGYDVAVRFAFLSGCRRMEILGLEWPHVDFFSRRFTVTGKGNKSRTIPMSDALFELLWSQKDFHPVKVFTYAAARTLKPQGLVKGQRYPLTESGLKTSMRRAVPNAGVKNFRFHDTRHTAATRVLRASNLKVTQRLLGHADIATTTKYAHAMDHDLRSALNSATASPTQIPTGSGEASDKILKGLGNSE